MANSALGSQTFTALALPSGVMMDYAGTSAPTGWLMCDGRAVLRSAYPELFLSIGTSYGVGDGVTTFNLPDFRGRFTRYNDNMGTVAGAAGRDVGRVHGSAQGQATAVNGLSNAGSGASVSGLKNQMNGSSGAESQDHTHQIPIGGTDDLNFSHSIAQNPVADGPGVYWTGSWTGGVSQGHWHSWDFGPSATFTATGTAAAQSITSSNTETRPINLSCNKIIKI